MNLKSLSWAVIVAVLPCSIALATAKPSDKELQKVIKTVVTAIRYSKDDLAAKQIAFEPMAKKVMGDYWGETSESDRKEIVQGLETLVRKMSFVKGRDLFKHLDAILYDPVRMEGDDALVKATVVVHRNYKKTEVVIDFVLTKSNSKWQIVDTRMLGESTAEGIHEDQVEPLVEDGGIAAVMTALRKKLEDVK